MITIDALRVRDGEQTPLDGVTMLLTANAVHGIAGEGRSVLLRAVYGLLTPESGRISAGGRPLRRRDMAYLEAEPHFWPGLTARDCIDLVRRCNPASDPAPLLILQLGTEGRTLLVAADSLTPLDGICDDLYVLGGGCVRGRYEHYEFQRAARETGFAGK